MADASLVWGGDLTVTPAGDIGLSDGPALSQQRVLRRLLTNQEDYTWQPGYGGALGQFVGQVAPPRVIQGIIRKQMFLEADVAHQPEPVIAVETLTGGSLLVDISYANMSSATPQALTFSIGN